ncbi:MAG: hypothetical protein HC817_11890 [Saprospiraceae bacterium]|nr:hypothetical protein [Saprospiraceae bacterium]
MKVNALNHNNQPLKTTVDAEIYLLQSPRRTYLTRLWENPDTATLSREDFTRLFPLYAFSGEDDVKNGIRKTGLTKNTPFKARIAYRCPT